MTASVGDLLAGVDRLVWELDRSLPQVRGVDVLAAWPGLALAAGRVLDVMPGRGDAVTRSVRLTLRGCAEGALALQDAAAGTPHPVVGEIALRLGAVADLLAGVLPASTPGDREAAVRLRASVLASVFGVAQVTATLLEAEGVSPRRWPVFWSLAERTQRFAVVPPAARAGRYEDVAAVTADGSLDGVLAGWSRVSVGSLSGWHALTGNGVQTAVGDVLVVTAAAATVVGAAVGLGLLDPERGGPALVGLRDANAAWRGCGWPPSVRLEGARPAEQIAGSQALRAGLVRELRRDGAWRSPEELKSVGMDGLLATMRRGLHEVANVALAHYRAVDALNRGGGRLWVAPTAITDRQERAWALVAAGRRGRWVPLPEGDLLGVRLVTAAREAVVATSRAVAVLDATASGGWLPPDARVALTLSQGRIAAVLAEGPPERVEGARRTPPPALPGHGPALGPAPCP